MKNEKFFAIAGLINYLVVVFLNAFTDLGHKILIQNTIFKIYDGQTQIILTAIINALILLPFILVFSPSGFLADRFAKTSIMKYSALFAIVITLGITFAYYHGMFYFAFGMTFLLALQSAIYAPAKYGYIKELVGDKFISSGNGAVQAVTTVAILGGIIFYSALFENSLVGEYHTKEDVLYMIAPLGWFLVGGSILEWFLASRLPNKLQEVKHKKVFNLKRYMSGFYLRKNLLMVSRKKEILFAILALSIFWSISQVVLAVFGEYAKNTLGVSNALLVQGVMALAGIGIVFGSILAAKLSKYFVHLGLSSIGAFGIATLLVLLPFLDSMEIVAVLFLLFGVFSGFILVPLNAHIQEVAPHVHLGTILAGNNFIQNIFMFTFLVLTVVFAYYGLDAQLLLYTMAVVALFLAFLLLRRYFVESIWSFLEILLTLRYRVNYYGLENIPQNQAVLLVGNHVSWLDWLLLQLPIQRKINYLINKEVYNWKWFHPFAKKAQTIPVSPKASKEALKEATKRLQQQKVVALFGEGGITPDCEIKPFKKGYEHIVAGQNVVIIAFYIEGMFGSIFSICKNGKKFPFLKREVNIYFSKPLPATIKAEDLRKKVLNLKGEYEA